MKFLLDTSPADLERFQNHPLVLGQLLTPLTRYAHAGGTFAIDNGAFTAFDEAGFRRLLLRYRGRAKECLFVAVPDVVGNARRTLEVFRERLDRAWIPVDYRHALVAQDGLENMDVPWSDFDTLFIGGRDPWKDSQHVLDLVRAAKILGKHVHVGRVNSPKRFKFFHDADADTCDGSGVVKFDHMLPAIVKSLEATNEASLFGDAKP